MSKILASLKPYFYYLVGQGIKNIEVRKSNPKADDWDREVIFYMSKDEKSFARIPKEYQEKYRSHFGKVGLKFVCDRIYNLFPFAMGTGIELLDELVSPEMFCKESCLTEQEICDYIGEKDGFGWHICDLKIYDKPKELSDFTKPCPYTDGTHCIENKCEYYGSWTGVCRCFVERPPQSWCYVEELKEK